MPEHLSWLFKVPILLAQKQFAQEDTKATKEHKEIHFKISRFKGISLSKRTFFSLLLICLFLFQIEVHIISLNTKMQGYRFAINVAGYMRHISLDGHIKRK